MYGILCQKDGDPNATIPIVKGNEGLCMATWESLELAKEFASSNFLCSTSQVMFIDLDNGEIDF